MTGAVSFVVKIFTEASASVASMVVTALLVAASGLMVAAIGVIQNFCLDLVGA